QREVVRLLNEEAFRRPAYFLDSEVLRRIEPSGFVDRIRLRQTALLSALFQDQRLSRLAEQGGTLPDGTAYTLSDLFADVRRGIFSEVESAQPSVDAYRRNLQEAFVDQMDRLINTPLVTAPPPQFAAFPGVTASTRPTDARALARFELQGLQTSLRAAAHMAGTPAQAATRDYVLQHLRSWGVDAWSKEYTVYIPQPEVVAAWVIPGPRAKAAQLSLPEPGKGPQVPPFNGYTGDGDVTAELVYVNYGLIEDYKTLDSLGISVRGKIAIARYGRSFRGIKAREAQKRGAVGLIVYSDPQEDGYFRVDVYPKGPMRPAGGIQRGSMMNGNGDPTTPGWASTDGARRLSEDSLDIPGIPIIPMSYGNARRLLEPLEGPSVPQTWEGALPFRYHVGPGPVRARLRVKTERGARGFHKIWNTVGMIRGARWPDEWVVVGGHRDAWGPGARDNVSGSVCVLETARAFATLARDGQKPART